MAPTFEEERSSLLHIVAELYARDELSEAEMNERIERISAASSLPELQTQLALVPANRLGDLALRSSLVQVPPQVVRGDSSVVRKKGPWLESRRIEVVGRGTAFKLDLMHYEGKSGIALEIDFDVKGSSVVVIVPKSFHVTDAIEDSARSVVKLRGKEEPGAGNSIVARGRVEASSVKFVRR